MHAVALLRCKHFEVIMGRGHLGLLASGGRSLVMWLDTASVAAIALKSLLGQLGLRVLCLVELQLALGGVAVLVSRVLLSIYFRGLRLG